ncbi:MAG TPA: hypothetical protein VM942_08845 [Acidimicrobiales bacterium]|nr:hypothetical protein [Acidimicrobiales bacterium]
MAATSTAKKSRTAPKMPIEDYDRLSVKAILPRLTTLSGPELGAVVAHEKAGKNRVTLLQAVRKIELSREAAAGRTAPVSRKARASRPVRDDDTMPVVVAPPVAVAIETVPPAASPSAPVRSELDDMHDLLDDRHDLIDDRHDLVDDNEDIVELDDEFGADEFGADEFEADEFGADELEAEDVVEEEDLLEAEGAFEASDEPDERKDAFDEWEDELAMPVPQPAPVAEVKAKAKAKAKGAPKPKPKSKKASAAAVETAVEEQARTRPPVKAATWEEELRPQLPRRIDSSSHDLDFEPPLVALVPSVPDTQNDYLAEKAARVSGTTKVRRKFEGAALVMAAILAILLGLAIGTILVRTDSVSAQSVPENVATQTASVPAGG